MKITKSKISKTESNIKILLEKEDYVNQFDSRLKDLKKKVNLKGFRTGMVPVQLLKNMYGKAVLLEEVNKIISEKKNKPLERPRDALTISPQDILSLFGDTKEKG